LQISKTLEQFTLENPDEQIAVDIIKEAILYPVIQIANNA